MSWIRRLYALLLRLHPRGFVREYRRDLLQNLEDRSRERRFRGGWGRVRLLGFLLSDLLRSAPREHLRENRLPARGRTLAGALGQDLSFTVRSASRRPGFTFAVVATLAVGIGCATAMAGIVDRVVLRPLPYPASERLVALGGTLPGWDRLTSVAPAEIHRWRERSRTFEALAASRLQSLTLPGPEGPRLVEGAGVSGSFFDVFPVPAWRGRVFGDADDRPGAARVAVLTHRGWQRHFGGAPGVLGRSVSLDGDAFTVIGILPSEYVPPEALYHGEVDVYFPLAHVADDVGPEVIGDFFLQAAGRLAPGVSPEVARDELAAMERELLEEMGRDPASRGASLEPLHERTVGDFGRIALPFAGAVLILLLVASLNVANLFLVRATERVREMTLRRSLGAARGRLVRQLLTESLFLTGLGGAAGVGLAYGGVALFRRLAPTDIPRAVEVGVDLRVLGFALVLTLLTGLLFGTLPALRGLGGLEQAGGAGGPGAAGGGSGRSVGATAERSAGRVRAVLVAAEVAVALVLVTGGGLLANSFVRLLATDLGLDPEGVAYVQPLPEGERYASPEARAALNRELLARVRALPGVTAAGGTNNLPLTANNSVRNVTVEGYDGAGDEGPDVSWHRVLPGYFETLGIGLLAGRTLTDDDDGTAGIPVVVSRTFARTFITRAAGGSAAGALGRRLHFGSASSDPAGRAWMEVVGVVEDVRQRGPASAPAPELYVPFLAFASGPQTLVARTGRDPAALASELRRAVREVDPSLAVRTADVYRSVVSAAVGTPRFHAALFGALAGTALLLAVVGVYGTLAYAVRQRRRELGVRIALGADGASIRWMVLRRGLALTLSGAAVGTALSLAGTRLLEGMVHGLSPTDPATLAVSLGVLLLAAVGASLVPAWAATRVDPVETLRSE